MSLIDDVKRAVENECRGLDPDGDALPTLLYRDADDNRMVLGLMMDIDDNAALFMTANMLVDEAIEAFYSGFMWQVIESDPEIVAEANRTGGWSGTMPSEHPDRVEKAMIAHYTPDGSRMYFASVIRSADAAPTLGEWVPDDYTKIGGRLTRHIEGGLKMVAGLSDDLRSVFRMAREAGAAGRDGAIRGAIKAMRDE